MVLIVHISGHPGSGKTTLGNYIENFFEDVLVKDTDDFSDEIGSGIFGDDWIFQMTEKIEKYIKTKSDKVKIIIFVGIMDQFLNKEHYMINMKKYTTHLLLLDVDPSVLLKQTYTRLANMPLEFFEKNYIESSNDILYSQSITNKLHIEKGYKLANRDHILKYIQNLLGNICNNIETSIEIDFIRYLETGYFVGTRKDIVIYKNGMVKYNKPSISDFEISKKDLQKLWDTLEEVKHVFQVYDFKKFTNPARDGGIDLYYYNELVAKKQDVPKLHKVFYEIISKK
jgi:adenylate kinase family enzyme